MGCGVVEWGGSLCASLPRPCRHPGQGLGLGVCGCRVHAFHEKVFFRKMFFVVGWDHFVSYVTFQEITDIQGVICDFSRNDDLGKLSKFPENQKRKWSFFQN